MTSLLTRLKQWFCSHHYSAVVTYGLDEDLLKIYGITRERPIASYDECKRCGKRVAYDRKVFVYFSHDSN